MNHLCLLELLDKDERIRKIELLKNKLVEDKKIVSRINNLKDLDIYSNNYLNIKKELFKIEDFVEFKELETEINYLILEINTRLKKLTSERRCNHESN